MQAPEMKKPLHSRVCRGFNEARLNQSPCYISFRSHFNGASRGLQYHANISVLAQTPGIRKPRHRAQCRGLKGNIKNGTYFDKCSAYFTRLNKLLQRGTARSVLTQSPLCANVLGTTLLSGTPHPVKLCGFFVPIGYYPIYGAFWFISGTKAQIRLADLRTNNRSRLYAVVAANTRRPSKGARVGLYQFNLDTGATTL